MYDAIDILVPHTVFAVSVTPTKLQVDRPGGVRGTHRLTRVFGRYGLVHAWCRWHTAGSLVRTTATRPTPHPLRARRTALLA
jgi:hypothetical protein